MDAFTRRLNVLLGIEGGYSDHAADSGGKTRYGITEAVARAHGYTGEMRALPLALAKDIYRLDYWDRMRLGDVARLSEPIAGELFDTGVNGGPGLAGEFLQRSLNVLNQGGKDYPDIVQDGEIGPRTLAALRAFLALRRAPGERVLLKMLNCLQGAFYVGLAESRAKDEAFILGWFTHRVVI